MESRNRNPSSTSSPLPIPPLYASTSIFQNVSNLRTPQNPARNQALFEASPRFFTPLSFSRSRAKSSALKSKAARRLKAFEAEQSKSCRRIQSEKEKSLKSLARSLTVWLNFLFENPSICGCGPESGLIDQAKEIFGSNGKRGSGPSSPIVGVEGPWRGPKRLRDSLWKGEETEKKNAFSDSMFMELNNSLKEICSFGDLKERMRMHLKSDSFKEIFEAMTQVTKNIDEGRLKMRPSCPIVSDVGMKEKAVKILMSYNPIWLRIGLYIILGGDSLLPNGGNEVHSEQEKTFLRMVLEKQFLSHPSLAKQHAYNKLVEGLYRPGYYEKLGNVILKRFLLLVIILDRAKSQTSLPIKYGIDGLDGGSPLLFASKSTVKSSRQLITEFLSSDVMHGEGNISAHLVIIGYKVTYQQSPLIEFDFKITDLFEDLQDGVRLCRAIELLKHDPSILLKVVVPSDTQKKSLVNVGIALQSLKQAGVPLLDEDGTEIIAEDVVNGNKELVLSFLWNIFIHLQLPLLIDKNLLSKEISSIRGRAYDNASNETPLNLLFSWIQAICDMYELKVENHSSLLDGKAMWCLLDYYFRKDCSCSSKDSNGIKKEVSIMSAIEYTDAVHNFLLSQKLTSLLGNFPEVLQVSDILENEGACNGKSVIVLLVFLSVQLLVKRNMDQLNYHKLLGFSCKTSSTRRFSIDSNNEQRDSSRDFRTIMAWWQDMAQHNGKGVSKPERKHIGIQRENAAIIIQSHQRRVVERRRYIRMRSAALTVQKFLYSWMEVKKKKQERGTKFKGMESNVTAFLSDRHGFVELKKSSIAIQNCIRGFLSRSLFARKIEIRRERLREQAAIEIQKAWKLYSVSKSNRRKHIAATKIQSHYHGWLIRREFTEKKIAVRRIETSFLRLKITRRVHAVTTLQSHFRGWIARREFNRRKHNAAATKIQSHYHGWLIRREFTEKKIAVRRIETSFLRLKMKITRRVHAVTTLQSRFRGWIARREFHRKYVLIVKLQSFFRGWLSEKKFIRQKEATEKNQAFIRGEITRRRFSELCCSIVKLQKWWRHVLQIRAERNAETSNRNKKHDAAVTIQSCWKGYLLAREHAAEISKRNKKHDAAVTIQSCWKGYLAREHAAKTQQQLLDLRSRMEKSAAANVDESRRLINRLIAAVSELLSQKSVSNILHTCATLDMATELSQRCCEELAAAGAVAVLLELIRSVSRSIPHQQVLKHALSTLRNVARYPHLAHQLIQTPHCIQTIAVEFLKNKEEGYFIASDLLKRLCRNPAGANKLRNSPAILKRLNNLSKKAATTTKTKTDEMSRLREVVDILKLISSYAAVE